LFLLLTRPGKNEITAPIIILFKIVSDQLFNLIISAANFLFHVVIVIIRVKNIKFFGLLCLSIVLLVGFMSPVYSGSASPENKTLMQPQGTQAMSTANRVSNSYFREGGT
jgi:hypothetical protein